MHDDLSMDEFKMLVKALRYFSDDEIKRMVREIPSYSSKCQEFVEQTAVLNKEQEMDGCMLFWKLL